MKKTNETTTKKQTSLKTKIVGIFIFPIALMFWCIDRTIHVIMPHANHMKFTEYLQNLQNIKWTIMRILTLVIPFYLGKLLWSML